MQKPFEPWLLTAYLLGELDLEQSDLVRQELIKNPALQSELQELQIAITKVKLVMNRATDSHSVEPMLLSPNQSERIARQIRSASVPDAPKLAPNSSVATLKLREVFAVLSALAAIGLFAALTLPTRWSGNEKLGPELSSALNVPAYLDNPVVYYLDDSVSYFDSQKVPSSPLTETGPVFDPRIRDVPVDMYVQEGNTGRFMLGGSVNSDLTTSVDKLKSEVNEALVLESNAASTKSWSLAPSPPTSNLANDGESKVSLEIARRKLSDNRPSAKIADATVRHLSAGQSQAMESKQSTPYFDGAQKQDYGLVLDVGSARGLNGELSSTPPSGPVTPLTSRVSTVDSEREQLSRNEGFSAFRNRHYLLGRVDAVLLGEEPQLQLTKQLGDRFESVEESNFLSTRESPLSTFSIDVDTASYSKIRQSLLQANSLPPANSVRIEEMLNYFEYDYAGPVDSHPFASNMMVGDCPWNDAHKLVRIGLQAKKIEVKDRPKANLVFLLDVSGSMDEPNKLPLVKQSIAMLVRQLGENDRISMVVYAGAAGCVLPSTTADKQKQILDALDHLNAGGSTNGGQGIELAYSIAKEHFIAGGINRVILCTDGDFNVGTTSDLALVQLVQEQAKSKVFLTCLGFGSGNYNDSMMEKISNHGNGIYAMIDTALEGRRVMIEQLAGSLMTVAKDVKIQIEFNPSRIATYRLIGYDNRRLPNQDFNDDKKDAGEIGAGHRVTALYEVVLVNGATPETPSTDELRYGRKPTVVEENPTRKEPIDAAKPALPESLDEWLTLKLRYKQPEADVSSKVEFHLDDASAANRKEDHDFQWAAAIAEFGLLLRGSIHAPQASWSNVLSNAKSLTGEDSYRIECLEMMTKARSLAELR